jgi:hypothetical protein
MSHPHPKHHPSPWPSHLLFSPAPSPRDHSPLPPTTCIVYPHRASAPPLATASLARARAPSCMGSLASCTLQPERCPVKLDGGLGRAHTNPLPVVHCPCRTVCVYGVTGCTADSSRAFGGNAPVLCSTVVDAARNGGSGSQAHSSHVGGPPSYSARWTPTTPTLASSPSVQSTFHRAPSAVRGGSLQ